MFTTFSPTYFPVGAAFPRACASVRPPGQGACLAPWGTLSIRHRSPQPSESPPSTSSSPSSGCCSPFPGGGGGAGPAPPLLPFRSMRASTTLSFHPRFCGRPASGGAGLMASSTRGVGDGGGREDGSARRGGRAWTLGGFGCETLGSELSWMARSASLPISSTKHGSKEPSLPPLRIPKILGIVIHTMEPKLKKGYQPKFSCLARRNEISPLVVLGGRRGQSTPPSPRPTAASASAATWATRAGVLAGVLAHAPVFIDIAAGEYFFSGTRE